MKAIIVAAGKGTRMKHLTEKVPKPMLVVAGKNLIEHKLDALPFSIKNIVITVGYLGEKIKEYFGDNYGDKSITYIEELTLQGTGYSVHVSRDHLKDERFLYMMGDDIYHKDDIDEALKYPWAMVVARKNGPVSGGRVFLNDDGTVKNIVEGTHEGEEILLNIGLFVVGKEIFNYELSKLPGRSEYGFPQQFAQAAKDFPVKVIISKGWHALSSPEDLERANQTLGV
ncbi:MAG: nucleotidyltransferase family protein [Candidatus Taylorbacteria bacterium]|nr:nucleotidyltransferase family protein [Candidatus Taylorbacteria bacterium]